MSSNYNISKDLKEAEEMVNNLSDYLPGNDLYGNTGGVFSNMPSLTVGALLMRLRRLQTLRDKLDGREQQRLDDLLALHAKISKDWASHYDEKLVREGQSRIDAMQGFFRECMGNVSNCASIYRPELLRRTIVQEIVTVMAERRVESDELTDAIRAADGRLRSFLREESFQWDELLEPVYPKREFWWLYQAPPQDAT